MCKWACERFTTTLCILQCSAHAELPSEAGGEVGPGMSGVWLSLDLGAHILCHW